MHSIARQVQDKSIALAVHTQVGVRSAAGSVRNGFERQRRRMSEETGQTAIEYGGILLLLALLFVAIFGLGLDAKLTSWGNQLITSIDSHSPGGGGGGGKPPAK